MAAPMCLEDVVRFGAQLLNSLSDINEVLVVQMTTFRPCFSEQLGTH